MAEILRGMRLPTGRTRIMTHCNMSFAQSGQYLSFMKFNDLIQTDVIAGRVRYQRTPTGLQFLELYSKMALLLESTIAASAPI